MDVFEKKKCRVCSGSRLTTFLDLGDQAPANALLKKEELSLPEKKFPLAVMQCADCELLQLTHIVSHELLFRNYVYFSSVSQLMSKHFAAYAADVADRFIPKDGLVVELGSNDGILLKTLLGRPLRVLGVDPARNVAEIARKNGVPTISEFFNKGQAQKIRAEHGPAHAIIGNNVIAHIDDLDSVVEGFDALLADDGVFVMEAPWVVPFIEKLEFDTIYHEHVSYLGVAPLQRLLGRYGLEVFDVRDQNVHGGTIRLFAQRKGKGKRPIDASVEQHIAREHQAGTNDLKKLNEMARKVEALREEIRKEVRGIRSSGKRVVGYTAPAKGNVLTQYCTLGPEDLQYMADATPAKQGLYNPGMHIPIVAPAKLLEDNPEFAMLFAWNLRTEIVSRESEWYRKGGRFIIPLPTVERI